VELRIGEGVEILADRLGVIRPGDQVGAARAGLQIRIERLPQTEAVAECHGVTRQGAIRGFSAVVAGRQLHAELHTQIMRGAETGRVTSQPNAGMSLAGRWRALRVDR